MSSDIVISIENLVKSYRTYDQPLQRILRKLAIGSVKHRGDFIALNNISLNIRKGETVGIIGRNGSGKSTLLQIICGIRKPTAGTVRTHGSIAALLELGAGFHPEFTGRENVYMQGAIMGISRGDMAFRFDEIAAFAGIGKFMDLPVKLYSSGMFVRLAFAVAASMQSDILVVDEALAVGDLEYQERSITRMKKMRDAGTLILLVSHSIPAVRNFCERVIWLERGNVMMDGNAGEVCRAYQEHIEQSRLKKITNLANCVSVPKAARTLHGSGQEKTIAIVNVQIDRTPVEVGSELTITFTLHYSASAELGTGFGLGVLIHRNDGVLASVFNTIRDDIYITGERAMISLRLQSLPFLPGKYRISANVCDRNIMFAYDVFDDCAEFEVLQQYSLAGIPKWEGEVACQHTWK